MVCKSLQLKSSQGALRAALYQHKAVIKESFSQTGDINLEIQLPEGDFCHLLKDSGLNLKDLMPAS
jgi:GTP-binding protein HflX